MRPVGRRAAVLALAVSLLASGCSLFSDQPGPQDTGTLDEYAETLRTPSSSGLNVMGRVRDGLTMAQANAALVAAKVGAPCEAVDAAARKVITDAGTSMFRYNRVFGHESCDSKAR